MKNIQTLDIVQVISWGRGGGGFVQNMCTMYIYIIYTNIYKYTLYT